MAAKKQRRGRICGEEATATKEAAAMNDWWRRNSGGEGSSGHEGWVEEGRDGIQMNPICFGGIRLSHVGGIHGLGGIKIIQSQVGTKHGNEIKNNPYPIQSQLPNGASVYKEVVIYR